MPRTAPTRRRPRSAVCSVREIPTTSNGDIDIDALKKVLGPTTAGIMLTNPSTIGVFERRIVEIARLVHEAGGLLYYDGRTATRSSARCGRATWALM